MIQQQVIITLLIIISIFYILAVVHWNNLSLFLLLLPRSLLSYNFVIKAHMACGVTQSNKVV